MQKRLLLFVMTICLLAISSSWAQTTVLDFETPATSTPFQYFGSSFDGTLTSTIANPNATGDNTSATVLKYVKPADAQTWAGSFSNPDPMVAIDAITNNTICLKFHTDNAESVTVKLENSTTGDNWELTQSTTTTGEWVTLCYDLTLPSEEAPNTAAAGHIYPRLVFFVGLGTAGNGTDSTIYYLDDFTLDNIGGNTTCNPVLDFETPATSSNFQIFGGNLDGSLTSVIANPGPDAINMSDSVVQFLKSSDAPTWGGGFTNPDPMTPVDLTSGNDICFKVWSDSIRTMALKLENSATGDNWIVTKTTTVMGGWEELCFDPNDLSIEAPNTAAAGHIYPRIVVFADFGIAGTGVEDTVYLDDFCVKSPPPPTTCNTVLDFEASATTTNFQIFGGNLEASLTSVIANPAPDAANMSDSVVQFLKSSDAPVWGGGFTNPDPMTPVDLTSGNDICFKVWSDSIRTMALKLENSATGDNWIVTKTTTVMGGWEELCFDPNDLSIEAPNTAAAGHIYPRIVVFADFGIAGTGVEDTVYLDDFCVQGPVVTVPDSADVTFTVDMNSFGGTFTQPYVSGTFNGWNGTANALSDADLNGVWTTTIKLPYGPIQYKFNYDDWAGQEEFNGTEKEGCTTFDGPFVNRAAAIAGDVALDTVCFNSCYACGEAVNITVNLSMGSTTPDAGGVYIAGGAEFGAPGGRFRMADPDSNNVYTITFERGTGFSGYHTFANGNCPDYSCKEIITGQACADPNNFDDRFFDPIMGDTTIEVCFEDCSGADCTTGINDINFTEGLFTVAPSLVSTFTKIEFSESIRFDRQIRVLSTNGQLILNTTILKNERNYTLDMASYAKGMYFIQVRIGNQFETKKVLKQ